MPLDAVEAFDWKSPDYAAVFRQREDRLERILADPESIPVLKAYYRLHPADFINDWGCLYEPRNPEIDQPAFIPFVLFPKQREWIDWVVDCWRTRKPGLTDKSRECGVSWLAMALSCTLGLHYRGFTAGFGSRKLELVDKLGNSDSLFWKGRFFMRHLPEIFRGRFDERWHSPEKLILLPETGSSITAEGGDDIGRGGRKSIYFLDESASHPHAELVDFSLSQTTNCRQDISTPRGMNNPFAKKRHGGKIRVFTFHWRQDPRKDEAWYRKQCEELDPIIVAQEIDLDYHATTQGVVIPSAWVQASVDAHIKLGITPSGARFGALDIADEGLDKNAFAGAHGVMLEALEEWSGSGSDIYASVEHAFGICDRLEYGDFLYDADGMGAAGRGDARKVNEERRAKGLDEIQVNPFRGSAAVEDPEKMAPGTERTNEDFFQNFKAQSWWALRSRFRATFLAISEGREVDPDSIISIPANLPLRVRLMSELSQPTWSTNGAGKMVIDKSPPGTRSPNLADAVMMRYSKVQRHMIITEDKAEALRAAMTRRGLSGGGKSAGSRLGRHPLLGARRGGRPRTL